MTSIFIISWEETLIYMSINNQYIHPYLNDTVFGTPVSRNYM